MAITLHPFVFLHLSIASEDSFYQYSNYTRTKTQKVESLQSGWPVAANTLHLTPFGKS